MDLLVRAGEKRDRSPVFVDQKLNKDNLSPKKSRKRKCFEAKFEIKVFFKSFVT